MKASLGLFLSMLFACALSPQQSPGKEELHTTPLKVSIISSKQNEEFATAAATWINEQCRGHIVATNRLVAADSGAENISSDYVIRLAETSSPSNSVLGLSFTNCEATVHIGSLKLGNGQDKHILTTRVEKCSLYALSKMLGAKDCPFPKCVMLPSQTYKQLDFKARNHCPPCSAKFRDLLQAKRRSKRSK